MSPPWMTFNDSSPYRLQPTCKGRVNRTRFKHLSTSNAVSWEKVMEVIAQIDNMNIVFMAFFHVDRLKNG